MKIIVRFESRGQKFCQQDTNPFRSVAKNVWLQNFKLRRIIAVPDLEYFTLVVAIDSSRG